MKKSLKAVLFILLFVVSAISMSGCIFKETEFSKNKKRIFETEYFRCINYEGEDTVTILSLTELGKKQEILVIPDKINGYKVEAIGGNIRGNHRQGQEDSLYTFAKKIYWVISNQYLNEEIIMTARDTAKVIFMAPEKILRENKYFFRMLWKRQIYSYADLDIACEDEIEQWRCYTQKCNVYFYDEEEIPYWIDYSSGEENEVFFVPSPTDKENLTFVGWCTDKERTQLWDGEYTIPDGQEELNLYAKFQETKN